MRRFETPDIADWFAASLRWIVLATLVVALAFRNQLDTVPFWPLTAIFVWNTIMSMLAVFSVRARFFHRQIVLTIDVLLAAAFFWLQSRVGSTPSWVGLIPILTGAVYFEALGAFIVAPLFAIWQTVIGEGVFYSDYTFLREVSMTLLAGLIGGISGRFLMRSLRTSRQTKLDVEERQRRMERERLRAIYELSSTLTATLSYRRVLDSARGPVEPRSRFRGGEG